MRRIFVGVLWPTVLALAAALVGCSGNGNSAADASVDSYGVIVPGSEGGPDEGTDADAGTGDETTMRLAHASPDLGPIDFCWRPTGAATFTGPVLGGGQRVPDAGAAPDAGDGGDGGAGKDAGQPDATVLEGGGGLEEAGPDAGQDDAGPPDASLQDAAPDAGAPGALVFGTMTPIVTLPAGGTYDIAIIAAGQTSCVLPRIAGTITLDAGKRATVVLMGRALQDAGPDALAVVSFTDDPLAPGSAQVRFIHAALGSPGEPAAPPLSVAADKIVLATEVDPQHASTPSTSPAVDALGYTTLAPLTPPSALDLSTVGDVANDHWTTAPTDLAVDVGTSHTGILVSLDEASLGVMWCEDSSAAGAAATCVLLPATNEGP